MLTHKKIQVGLLALTLVLASATTFAAAQWCSGTIKRLFVYASGGVGVFPSWRNDYVDVCNINQTVNSITPQNCQSWFALLQTAYTSKKKTIIYYSNAPVCNTIPTYSSAPTPGYVMLLE